MRRSQWIVFILGSIFILVGLIGQLTHSLWSDTINAGLGAFGSLINLMQLALWLSSKEIKILIPTRITNKTSIVPPRASKFSEPPHFRTNSKHSSHYKPQFELNTGIGIGLILISIGLSGLFISRLFVSNSDLNLIQVSSGYSIATGTGSSITSFNTIAWSPDAKYIAAGGNNGKVEVWDIARKRILCTYSAHKGAVLALAWSHDGTRLASGGVDDTVRIWSAENCHSILTYTDHTDAVYTVAWSPNDIRIATGSGDETVKVWDVVDGATVNTYPGQHYAISSVAWSADGTRIASIANNAKNQVQIWDATTGSNVISSTVNSQETENTVAWSPDDTRIAFNVGSVVQVRDASSIGKFVSINCLGHQKDVNTVAWSPNSLYVASGSNDDTIRVCDSTTGSNIAVCRGHASSVNDLEWASRENRIAFISDDGTIQVCDALSGHNLITLRA